MSARQHQQSGQDFVCETCGTYFYDRIEQPEFCPICEDDRQYVPPHGQRWLTANQLSEAYTIKLIDDDGLPALGLEPSFAINQRAILIHAEHVTVLWEALPLVTSEAIAWVTRDGPVDFIALSHPHFYSAMERWSEALGGIPILVHESDREWVPPEAKHVQFWTGEQKMLAPGVKLLRVGGHFPGSAALHWQDALEPNGVLFPGDALQVSNNRKHVSFLYSYPNAIPMNVSDVIRMRELLSEYSFERVYGFTWQRNILSEGKAKSDWSFERFLSAATS